MEQHPNNATIILFGATGDLANRKLYPAFYQLYKKRETDNEFAVIGVARRKKDHEAFREMVRESIQEVTAKDDRETVEGFLAQFFYHPLDVNDLEAYVGLLDLANTLDRDFRLSGNRLFYLALAPEFFSPVTLNIKKSGLSATSGWKRLVIEKPFGRDLTSAKELNQDINQVFNEEEIYRIDHYLGKEMVQNIQVVRFSNPIFESIWNNRYISNIQITSSETLGVGERASYYDQTGALMDMVQNHMLQMVSLVAMEPPSRLETEDIRNEKVKAIKSLRPFTKETINDNLIIGQYTEGSIDDEKVIGYLDEENIANTSKTETFVAAKLMIDNFRWAGVPIYIRTGKRMEVKSTEIVIQFKDAPMNLYPSDNDQTLPNLLIIHVQPDEGLTLKLNAKKMTTSAETLPISMEYSNKLGGAEAYERLINDAIKGDSTNFTRWDEVALSWEFVDRITKIWSDKHNTLHTYPSGTMGPQASDELLAKDGFHWWPLSKVDHNKK